MRFELRPPHILYHDEHPYKNVAVSTPRGDCLFDLNASSFDDGNRRYTWAFIGNAYEGETIIFSSVEVEVVGTVAPDGSVPLDRAPRPVSPPPPPVLPAGGVRILVGAGSDAPKWSKEGWFCNDIESAAKIYEGINIIGPCWALPIPDNSVDEIMARGMIEHLTYHEVLAAFKEWMRVLKPGGFFTGEVPDADEYIREYLKMRAAGRENFPEGSSFAEGEPDDNAACSGIERWLRRALYGWQRWPGDEHRSGWDEKLFAHYLNKCGASKVEVRHRSESFDAPDDPASRVHHLWARAWK